MWLCIIVTMFTTFFFYKQTAFETWCKKYNYDDLGTEAINYDENYSTDEQTLILLSSKYLNLKDYNMALRCLLELSDKFTNSKVELALAEALASVGKLEEAWIHFERSIGIVPNSVKSRYQYFLWLKQNGYKEQALAQADTIMTIEPKIVSPLYMAIRIEIEKYLRDSVDVDSCRQ